jgi:SAM-dependent methyltransferase
LTPHPVHNRDLYADEAFEHWAHRSRLTTSETVLVRRFLDPEATTVEAGTGGGRILHELRALGFTRLYGFDNVPRMVETARRRDESRSIGFTVQDAVALQYGDGSFDQAIYLQQLLSFIEPADDRLHALREARRILRPGGTALFSFLCFETRMKDARYAGFARYLSALRRVRGRRRSLQSQPWLHHGPRVNLEALLDRPPHVYWFRVREAAAAVRGAGFRITAAASQAQLARDELFDAPEALDVANAEGMIYLVAQAV